MLKIKKRTPQEQEEKRTATRKVEQVEKMRRGLEAHQENELNKQIASAAEKVIEECKRVLNTGIRDYVNDAIEKGWSERFNERIEMAANVFFNKKAELKKFPLLTFAETLKLIDEGWRVIDIVSCGSIRDGIWCQRFHKDRKEEKKKEVPVKATEQKKKIKVSLIKRRV